MRGENTTRNQTDFVIAWGAVTVKMESLVGQDNSMIAYVLATVQMRIIIVRAEPAR
jgi:hypothetical protein